jgi:hypothetical protein
MRRLKRLKPSPALAISVIALLVVAGAPATAAQLITGKSVKNSSLTGKDIKNKSLTPKDFRGSVRGSRGPKGDKGDKGDPGSPGSPGQAGSALAYAHVQGNATLDGAYSKGVTDVKRFPGFANGFYCIYGNFTARNAQATVDYADSSGNEYVQDLGLKGRAAQVDSCPAGTGSPVAIVLVRDPTNDALSNAGFYISFN